MSDFPLPHGDAAAHATESSAALEELDRLEAEAERLQDVLADLALMDWPELPAALEAIATATASALRVRRVSVWRYDRTRSGITCALLWQDGVVGSHPLVITASSAPHYWEALHRGRTLAVENAERDPATQDLLIDYILPLGIGALMDTGIRIGGDTLGIVCVEHLGGARRWTGAERIFLGSIGERVGIAMVLDERRRVEAQALGAQRFEAACLLAAGVAHDFNNLVGAILTSAELAYEGLSLGADVAEDLDTIRVTARRAATLTRKLLTVARKEELVRERLDLGALTRGFLPVASSLVGRTARLETALTEEPLPVLADAGFIDRALLNLVTNAVHAMPDGGTVTIRTSLLSQTVARADLGALPEGLFACLSVADTGVGVPREVLPRICEPFYTTKGEHGTGLGLAVVYGGLQQHGGHLLVESAPGRGSTFHLCLPLLEP